MKIFKDVNGKEWQISITVGTIKRVKDLMDVNLIDAVSTDLIDKMKSDPVFLCDILYAICKPQADKDGVSDIEFGEGLVGDAIASATDALIGDLVDFFPASQRVILRKALAKIEAAEKQMTEMMDQKIDAMMDSEIEKRVRSFTESFGQ
ncbi:MAG: hypothetical protein WCR17_04525 [Candidatus Methanomethylophilaceae archaeon]